MIRERYIRSLWHALFMGVLLSLAGCATPLYEDHNRVSLYLVGEPTVKRDSFEIQFQFETPTDDPHVIQWIEMNNWTGVESFRVLWEKRTGIDTHFSSEIQQQSRRMTVAPGRVEGVDETTAGFAMLPSEWPEGFNAKYRERHTIQGRVAWRKADKATVYRLEFTPGKLVWSVEGTNVRREWHARGQ